MIKTISIPTWNRLDYLKQVIEGLGNNNQDLLKEYILIFSCEPHEETIEYVRSLDLPVKDIYIDINSRYTSVVLNPYKATMLAYEKFFADINVFLEDDDIPAQDMLELAEWYINKPISENVAVYGLAAMKHDYKYKDNIILRGNYFWGIGYMTKRDQWIRFFQTNWLGQGHGGVLEAIINDNAMVYFPAKTRIKNVGINGAHCNEHVYYTLHELDKYQFPNKYISQEDFKLNEKYFYTHE
jgi:hypothetical protein